MIEINEMGNIFIDSKPLFCPYMSDTINKSRCNIYCALFRIKRGKKSKTLEVNFCNTQIYTIMKDDLIDKSG